MHSWGAAAAIAAAIGPLLGGFVTTYLSWRVGFLLEVIVIAGVLANLRLIRDVRYTGPRRLDVVGAGLSVLGMGGIVLGILVWQDGGEFVGALIGAGAIALTALAFWLVRRHRQGKVRVLDPELFRFPKFRVGVTQQMLQQITLGGAMIALPIFLQIALEYNALQAGLSLAPLSLTMFATALVAARRASNRRPANLIGVGRSPRSTGRTPRRRRKSVRSLMGAHIMIGSSLENLGTRNGAAAQPRSLAFSAANSSLVSTPWSRNWPSCLSSSIRSEPDPTGACADGSEYIASCSAHRRAWRRLTRFETRVAVPATMAVRAIPRSSPGI